MVIPASRMTWENSAEPLKAAPLTWASKLRLKSEKCSRGGVGAAADVVS
jgi:hypothetical protein